MKLKLKKEDDEREYARLVAEESLIFDVTEEISRVLAQKAVSRKDLAERLGKSKGYVTQVLSGERNMTLRTVADIAHALEHRFDVRAVPEHIPYRKDFKGSGPFVMRDSPAAIGRKYSSKESHVRGGASPFNLRGEQACLKDARVEDLFPCSPESGHEYSLAS